MNNNNEQSDTSNLFSEIKQLARDFDTLRNDKKRIIAHMNMLLGENAILRERNRSLIIRIDELKQAAEHAGKVTMAHIADTQDSTTVIATFDRMYYIHDDENSIEKYIKDNTLLR